MLFVKYLNISSAFPALFLVWWLTFCCPKDLYYNSIITGPFGGTVRGLQIYQIMP